MKAFKKIVTVGIIACMCIAFGGMKVTEAADCCSHEHVNEVGGVGYSQCVGSHDIIPYKAKTSIDPVTGKKVVTYTYDFGNAITCYATVRYNDVALICTDCGEVTDSWKEKAWYDHTHWKCPYYSNEPIKMKY